MLDVFSIKILQETKILLQLYEADHSIEDVIKFIDKELKNRQSFLDNDNLINSCPKCGKNWRYCSVLKGWFCKCGYSKLNT